MSDTKTLVEAIFRNSQMGMETLGELLELKLDGKIKKVLDSQNKEYTEINKEAKKLLETKGFVAKDVNAMAVAMSKVTINVKTMMNKSSGHIAEMVMQGNCNGIIEAVKNIKQNADADADVMLLAQKLLKTEENNFNQLKEFLG